MNKTEHLFNDRERQFVKPQVDQINMLMAAVNNAVGLFCATHDLEPREWRLKQDGSGLERVVPEMAVEAVQ